MIQYLSDLIKSSLSEKIAELGFSDIFVGMLEFSCCCLSVFYHTRPDKINLKICLDERKKA